MDELDVRMLGGFEVRVNGSPLPDGAFAQRRAADLVKVLALAPGHRLSRDRVVELLWPRLAADAGSANLHKAAHYARRALELREAIVLKQGLVELCPGAEVSTDVERFENGGDYAGELLPDDRYEDWTVAARERLREQRLTELRARERWEDVLREDPADERAHQELMRRHHAGGDRLAAARQFQLLRDELARNGLHPSADTLELQRELSGDAVVHAPRLLTSPVLGRDAELRLAVAALRQAAEGCGTALLVVGEAGMGKTRYAEAVLAGGERRGWHTLRGRARTAGGEIPYHAVFEALEPLLHARPDLLARLSPGARAALAAVSPAIATTEPIGRHRVFAAVGHLLREAALDRGVVLAVEDLHAADEATLELLDFLTGGARGEPLLIVATTRPADGGASISRLRGALREQPTATVVTLGPLPEAAIQALAESAAGRELPEATQHAIVAAAAGNPLYAQELARAVEPSGRVRIPERLQALLDERLSDLPRAVLPVLAVLEDGFSADELATVAHVTPGAAEELLASADVLEREGDGWRFTHPLLRDAARRRAPAEALRGAHTDAAAALERDGAPPERIAYHLLQAGRGEEALPQLVAAARHAAAIGAYADGRRWVEQALLHAGEHRSSALHALLGDLRFATGDRGALTAYENATRYASEEELPDVKSRHGRAAIAFGDLDVAERALAGLPAGSVTQRAHGCVTLAMLAWHRGELEQASRLIDQAGALGEAAGTDVELLPDVRAMIAHAGGRWESHAPVALGEAWQLPALAGRVFDAYLCVTEYVLNAGDPYERVIRFAEDLRGQAERAGARRGEAFSTTVLGEAHLMRGELETAREELEHAVRVSREVGAVGGEALARIRLGEALAALGDRTGARAQLEEALELSHASTLSSHLLFLVHAPLVRVQDDTDAAVAMVDRAEQLLGDAGTCNFCPLAYLLAAAAVCARAGDLPRAESFLTRAEHAAELWPTRAWSPGLCEARGEILRAREREDEAAVAFRRALEGYTAAGQELNAARVRATL